MNDATSPVVTVLVTNTHTPSLTSVRADHCKANTLMVASQLDQKSFPGNLIRSLRTTYIILPIIAILQTDDVRRSWCSWCPQYIMYLRVEAKFVPVY